MMRAVSAAALLMSLLLGGPLAQEPPPTAPDTPPAGAYAIGPEDVVRITVYGHEDLTQSVVVEPDGTVVFPLLGRIKAAGLTPRELEQSLVSQLEDGYIRKPQVAVVVQAYRSNVVYVMGEVTRPGRMPLPDARTLVEVLALAGPLLGTAGSEVLVLRARAGVPVPAAGADPAAAAGEVIRVELGELQAGAAQSNIVLRPGDTVLVPRAARVYVTGRVKNPGAYPIAPGMTVRQAIGLAGGFAGRARSTVRVVRKAEGGTSEVKARLDERLRADDTVVVEGGSF